MVFIANSDIKKRLDAARKEREKAPLSYGAYTGEIDDEGKAQLAEEERKSKRSNWNKFTDTAKIVGDSVTSSYRRLGDTLGTIASAPGMNKKVEENQKQVENLRKQATQLMWERFPEGQPPLSQTNPERDKKLERQFRLLQDTANENSKAYDWWTDKENNLSVKDSAYDIVSIGADVLSAGSYEGLKGGVTGARAVKAARAAEAADKALDTAKIVKPVLKTAFKGAAKGAAINAGSDLVLQQLDNEKGTDLKRLGIQGGLGAVLGGLSTGLDVRKGNKAASKFLEADKAMINKVDEGAGAAAKAMDAEDAARKALTPPEGGPKLLDAGESRIDRRIKEIDDELDGLRKGETDPNAYMSNPEDLATMKDVPAADVKLNKDGSVRQSGKGKVAGTFASDSARTLTDSSDTAARARELMRERKALTQEAEGLASVSRFDGAQAPKLDVNDPQFKNAVESELKAVDNAFADKQVKKVNSLVDYFRTPTKVLNKLGLTETARTVEKSFENYRKDLLTNLKTLQGWEKRVGNSPEASNRIFKHLDGQDVRLSGEELKVANEMRAHFDEWADKLGLPKEGRVSDYITHIFEGDFNGKTSDVTLSSILDKKGTSKAYNPFTQKRLGKQGYKEDAFAAMEAYMKKSTRQLNMDPALKITADAAKNVDDRTARYILSLNKSLAMKPGKAEQVINDIFSSIPGVEGKFGNQAGTKAMRAWRNTVYRATLGLNVGSALRNLTQGTNTFAELGTRDTLKGYSQLIRTFGEAAEQKASGKTITAWDELTEHGILDDALTSQDRNITTLKKKLDKADKGLWAMFDTAERINRGSAYFGAKSKAMRGAIKGIAKGDEEAAIAYAKDVVGKTQFRFNDVETPLALRSQVAKTLGQFQSFNVKQAEFLAGTANKALHGDAKEIAKVIRWVGANVAVASTVGTVLGLKWYDAVPDFGTFRGVRSPLLQAGQGAKELITRKDEYGQDESFGDAAKNVGKDMFGLTVPGGTQIKKSKEGIDANNRGGSFTDSGKLRFTVDPNSNGNSWRAPLFGQYNTDEGQNYFDNGRQAFTQKQTDVIGDVPSGEEKAYEEFFRNMGEKLDSKQNTANKIREEIKNKNFAKAKRLASEHNAAVEQELAGLGGKVGRPSKDIVDYVRSTYKVDFDYYKRNPKKDE